MQTLDKIRARLFTSVLGDEPLRATTWRGKLREIAARLLRERATPLEVGQAVAIGVWVGTSPAFGVHGWLALAMATALKKNRVFAFVGSRVSFFLLLPWIVISEIEVGSWLRTGRTLPLERDRIVAEATRYLGDLCLGWLVLGPIYALVLGGVAALVWRLYKRPPTLPTD